MNQEQIESAARAAYVEMEWPDRITEHDSNRRPDGEYKDRAAKRWDEGNAGWAHYRRYRRQAAAVIAAIHPTVDSVEELNALPAAAIVRSAQGTIACRHWDNVHGVVFGDDRPFPWERLDLPATVLHMGGAA